jgi:large subunit ribosomal protein L5
MAKGKKTTEEVVDTGPAQPPRLRESFRGDIAKAFGEQFGITNPMQRPKLDKIVVSVNMGRHLENNKLSPQIKDTVIKTLGTITGQKPIVIRAKKSVSNFKVREGAETSAMVTIRRERMWHFLDRLINLSMPRIKDFRGVSTTAFDKDGNYSLGLNEQGVFPEIDMTNTNFTHGMNITLVFTNSDPEKSRFLLEKMGMPFRKKNEPGAPRA